MTITAAWTDPTTLDKTVGQTLDQATWEDAIGDILYLYDALTAALALAVHLTSTLHVDGILTASSGVLLGAGGTGAGPDVHADGTNVYVETNGAGQISLRPNGTGVTTNQATLSSAGVLAAPTFSGAVSGSTGAFSGAVTSNGHPVVEGTAAASHVECIAGQSAVGVGTGASVSVTLTFARAYASEPAWHAAGQTSAGNTLNIGASLTSVSTSAITVAFKNTDGSTQTLSHLSITCTGA